MAAKKSTDVVIAGKSYTLSGYEEEGYLQRIADYINRKIAEMDEGMKRRIPNETRAILIGLNMAHDYYRIRDQFDEVDENYKKAEKELFNLKHELVDSQMRVDELLSDLEKEKKKAKAKPAVDKELQARYQKLVGDYQILSDKSAEQSEAYRKLESKYTAVTEHSKQLEAKTADLEEELKAHMDGTLKSQEDYEKLAEEKKALEAEVQELRLNKKRLEKTLEDALLGTLQSERSEMAKSQEKEEKIEKAESDALTKNDNMSEEDLELQELARQIEELEREEQQKKQAGAGQG